MVAANPTHPRRWRTPATAPRPVGRPDRSAFTLIELLVVIALLVVLTTIAVLFIPNLGDRSREADGAALLQGWLNIAKARALRDGVPRGIRLFPYNNQPPNQLLGTNPPQLANIVVEAQYLDQPDDLFAGSFVDASGSPVWTLQASSPGFQVTMQGVDLFGGNPGDPNFWMVRALNNGGIGDYLQIQGTGFLHQITDILQPNPKVLAFTVTLASSLPHAVNQTSYFHVIRSPRVSGEERLIMPSNIGIDLNTNNAALAPVAPPWPAGYWPPSMGASSWNGTTWVLGPPYPGYSGSYPNGAGAAPITSALTANADGSVDILFAPAGNVMGSQVALDRVILWVRDYTLPAPYVNYQQQGEPTLVVVNTRTGMVAAVPVDPTNGFIPFQSSPYPPFFPGAGAWTPPWWPLGAPPYWPLGATTPPPGTPYTFVLNP